jgi:hypothetical protein
MILNAHQAKRKTAPDEDLGRKNEQEAKVLYQVKTEAKRAKASFAAMNERKQQRGTE